MLLCTCNRIKCDLQITACVLGWCRCSREQRRSGKTLTNLLNPCCCVQSVHYWNWSLVLMGPTAWMRWAWGPMASTKLSLDSTAHFQGLYWSYMLSSIIPVIILNKYMLLNTLWDKDLLNATCFCDSVWPCDSISHAAVMKVSSRIWWRAFPVASWPTTSPCTVSTGTPQRGTRTLWSSSATMERWLLLIMWSPRYL